MRRSFLSAFLALAATALFVTGPLAAPVNIVYPLNADGTLPVTESSPLTGYRLISPAILSTQFLHYNTAGSPGVMTNGSLTFVKDSSSVEDVAGYNQLALHLSYTLDDSTGSALFAISFWVGATASSDSLSRFAAPRLRTLSAPSDTIGSFLDRLESAAVTGVSGLFPYERPLVVSHMNGARGMLIEINDRDGKPLTGDNIFMTWRHIASYKPDLSAAWTNAQEQRLVMRADLVGRRN